MANTRARAGRSSVRFYLSANARVVPGAPRLEGVGATPALRSARRATLTVALEVPASVKPGRYRFIACADDLRRVKERSDSNNCAAAKLAVEITAQSVSASQLIARDLAAKKVSRERSLVLRALALFGDPRLPARYRGDTGGEGDDGIVRTISSEWPALSKSARRTLGPFLIPPAARGSWLSGGRAGARAAAGPEDPCDSVQLQQPGWSNFSGAGGKLRFWYRTDNAEDRKAAQGYARDIGQTAYPRLKKLFGRDLLSDAKAKCFHGPDGATDVYIVPRIANGLVGIAIPSDQSPKNNTNCSATPSFMRSSRGCPAGPPRDELFHSFQFTYSYINACKDYLFWDEATATWGAHFVFPLDDFEHRFDAMQLFPWGTFGNSEGGYDRWLYPLFLERTLGEQTIPATYSEFAKTGPLTGIDKATGGFKARWREFTKLGWNRHTVAPTLQNWDRFYAAPGPDSGAPLTLDGSKQRSVPAPVRVAQLAREYKQYPVSDPKVAEVIYRNRLSGDPRAAVWAELTFADGSQRVEDWTDRKEIRFCRTTPGQNVQNVVLMTGNTEWQSEQYLLEPNPAPSFDLRDTCDDTLRYEILSASFSATTYGQQSVDQYCDSVSSTKTFAGEAPGAFFDPANTVKPKREGEPALSGEIGLRVPSAWTHQLQGCDDMKAECSTTLLRKPMPDGTWPITVLIEATSIDASTATLTWNVENPSVGFIDADPSVCNVTEFFQGLPASAGQQQVPMADLKANGPTTLTLEGGPLSWNTDFTGDAAVLTYSFRYTMTVRRVAENGQPL